MLNQMLNLMLKSNLKKVKPNNPLGCGMDGLNLIQISHKQSQKLINLKKLSYPLTCGMDGLNLIQILHKQSQRQKNLMLTLNQFYGMISGRIITHIMYHFQSVTDKEESWAKIALRCQLIQLSHCDKASI